MRNRSIIPVAAILAAVCMHTDGLGPGTRAGAAAETLSADDAMVIGGGIGPGKARGQEGELRASAVVIEDGRGGRVALIACDVLMIERDVLDRAARRVEQATGVPFDHILINATHTHHAPTTVTIHGYERDEAFTRQVEDKIVQSGREGRPPARAVPPSCSGWGRNPRSGRTAGYCSATGRSTGSAPTTTRCGRPGRSTRSCRSWPSAGATAASRRSSSITRRTRSARRSPASARRHSTAWPRRSWRRSGAGPSSSSKGPRARRTTSACRRPRRPTASARRSPAPSMPPASGRSTASTPSARRSPSRSASSGRTRMTRPWWTTARSGSRTPRPPGR